MKYTAISILLFCVIIFSACEKSNPDPGPQDPAVINLTPKASEVIGYTNNFGIRLFQAVAQDEPDENLMISPLSAGVALTMLLNGCDGNTYSQIKELLSYDDLSTEEINGAYRSLTEQLLAADPKVQLALANAVWYRNGFVVKSPFVETMQTDFDARTESLDFSSPLALETINGWAADNTNGKINQVLDQISGDAMMFLMNALYFKGDWTWQFDPELTADGPFYLQDGTSITVPMMQGKINAKTFMGEGFAALELFYGRKNFSMVIVLPDDGLENWLENLEPSGWTSVTTGLDQESFLHEVMVTLPKFSFEYEKRLNDQLQALGMSDAFNPALADLSRIADAQLFVSFVKQNTFIDVNEEGTEAAAVTTIGVETTSVGEDQFDVDRPFVFAIREQTTNTLMFIGKVENPL
ncbi:MAG: serpin family protein [Bacteroidales bacterium]